MDPSIASRFPIGDDQLAAFCKRWKIVELSFFGSILRDDFEEDSDIDLLVTFEPRPGWSVLDHIRMESELSGMVGRRVEIVSRQALDENANWLTRRTILESARLAYAA